MAWPLCFAASSPWRAAGHGVIQCKNFNFAHKFHSVQIHTDINNFDVGHPVATMGMFDGVHNGHRHLISELIRLSAAEHGQSTVITFWPHPKSVISSVDDLRFLTTQDEKTALIASLGVEHLVVIPFDRELSRHTPGQFMEQVLADRMGVRTLLVGFNHRFGAGPHPDDQSLKASAAACGISIVRATSWADGQVECSSSVIRNLLCQGDIGRANALLGRRYSLCGMVEHGRGIGRTLGFPTANVRPDSAGKLLPGAGVYACFATVAGRTYDTMLNIGTCPTFAPNQPLTVEAHLIDCGENLYGKSIRIEFAGRIRDERRFDHADQLVQQLRADRTAVRALLRECAKND